MPTPKTTTKNAPPVTESKITPSAELAGHKLARRIYEEVHDELEGSFDSFLEGSSLEEKRFLRAVLINWSSITYGRGRGPAEYDVPLYAAIELELSGLVCVTVPLDSQVIRKVEEFVAALEKKHWKVPQRVPPYEKGSEAIHGEYVQGFRTDIEIFARHAGIESLRLMRNFLIRWNELAHDPEGAKIPNVLAEAAEIELDNNDALRAIEDK